DLGDVAAKGSVRVGVDREGNVLAEPQPADVSLVHRDLDIYGAKIPDGEQGGGLETGGNRLARGDAAVDHDAVHWRSDHGSIQIGFGLVKRCLTAPDLGF